MGAATTARQKSKIEDIWASMNASEAPLPGGASGSGVADGKGKGKTRKKKKACKKANKVKKRRCLNDETRSTILTIATFWRQVEAQRRGVSRIISLVELTKP